MNLSEHFTFAELVESDYALRHGLNNLPDDARVVGNLSILAAGLERVRAILARPMVITSGYRSKAVNAAVGSKESSAHRLGLAADFKVPGLTAREVCLRVKDHASIGYQQLICEGGWTHIAFPEDDRAAPKMEVLTAIFKPGRQTSYVRGIA